MSTTLAKPQAQTQLPTATNRNPFALLRKEMDDLVARFWDGEQEGWLTKTFSPSTDLTEKECVRNPDGCSRTRGQRHQRAGPRNTVTISGERKEEKEEKGKTYHRIERRSGSFSRTLALPCEVNEDEVAAEYAQGVLTLTLPKCDTAKAKKIAVKG